MIHHILFSAVLVILSSFLFLSTVSQANILEYEDQGTNRRVKFNYDPNSNIGPNKWHNIDTKRSEYKAYFGNKKKNTCDGNMQLKSNQMVNAKILNKTKRGAKNFDSIKFQILPGALRAKFPKKNGPLANFSNLSLLIPALHVEIKLQSEHYLFGKQYDGEFTIVHDLDKSRLKSFATVSVMMEIGGKENPMLELFVREWEEVARKRLSRCQGKNYNREYDLPSSKIVRKVFGAGPNWKVDYELYKMLPTIWYCGYEGSLTVPPCFEDVQWRVYDLPMKFSRDQYKRIKALIFDQLDNNCEQSTSDYKGEVNRPLQLNTKSRAWCCDSSDWEVEERDFQHYDGLWDWPKKYHGHKHNIFN